MTEADYLRINRANWDERAPLHARSAEYDSQRYAREPELISDVVQFDRSRLGDIAGLNAVHLQCHIGTDTLSLHRLGAQVSGLDLSPVSISLARELADAAGADIDYVVADVYDAAAALNGRAFDLVYTGIGALCWLPDIARWARTVAALLAPGGRLFLREGHPMLWAVDEEITPALTLGYPYFEQEAPTVWDDPGSYVETTIPIRASVTHEWNHGLGEIITALLDTGLTLTALTEHTSAPWEAIPGRMELGDHGEWQLSEHRERLPLSYTLQARAPL